MHCLPSSQHGQLYLKAGTCLGLSTPQPLGLDSMVGRWISVESMGLGRGLNWLCKHLMARFLHEEGLHLPSSQLADWQLMEGGGRVELDFGLTVPVRLMPCHSSTCGLDHCGCGLVVFVVCNIGGLVRDFAVILGLFWCSFGEII